MSFFFLMATTLQCLYFTLHMAAAVQAAQIPMQTASFSPEVYMRRAIELAKLAKTAGGAPFGAVIVDIVSNPPILVSEGMNNATINPVLHAEIQALSAASSHFGVRWQPAASRCALFTTAESCPMCASAIVWAGIRWVYYGSSIAFLQQHGWGQIDVGSAEVAAAAHMQWNYTTEMLGGVLEDECNVLYRDGPEV